VRDSLCFDRKVYKEQAGAGFDRAYLNNFPLFRYTYELAHQHDNMWTPGNKLILPSFSSFKMGFITLTEVYAAVILKQFCTDNGQSLKIFSYFSQGTFGVPPRS